MENPSDLLLQFNQQLERSIQHTWETNHTSDYIKAFVIEARKLVDEAKKVGNAATEQLTYQEPITHETLFPFLITYRWAEQVKSFLILWRNVQLEAQKAQVLLQEEKITEDVVATLKTQSKTQVEQAVYALKQHLTEAKKEVNQSKKGAISQIETWRLQQNPWTAYLQQIEQIPQQCELLFNTQKQLLTNVTTFANIRVRLQNMISLIQTDTENVKIKASSTVDYINEYVEEKPGRIAVHLESMESKFSFSNHIKVFAQQLEQITENLSSKLQVPTTAIQGMIQTKEINFRKSTTQWMESEILPLLYEVEEITENVSNGLKMAIVNIRNRALLLANEQKTEVATDTLVAKEIICQPLHTFLKNCEGWENNIEKLFRLIQMRINKHLKVSKVYDTEEFLPIPLQSTINQLRQNQNDFVTGVRAWWQKRTAFITKVKENVELENTLTSAEKIARFLETYRPAADNPQYASIFLTKGYVGDSFWVGRHTELTHIKTVIDQWRNGFRGAMMLTGQRFAGKTLFGDTIANRFFPNDTIALSPNSVIQINGRRLKTEYHLATALNFIKNNTLNSQPLVWIDDLELWTDPTISFNENIRQLCNFIDRYAHRIFFMVSTSNWQNAHLNTTADIKQYFQTEINLDRMSLAEIQQAILIRHGATHKTLVNKDGEKTSPQHFNRMTKNIYYTTQGNIGNSLNRWSAATVRYNEDKVMHNISLNYVLPDFINSDNGVLLHAITMKKRTNEYRLRKLFGPAFKVRFSNILQRLISMGLVNRHIDGWLEINEAAANEVAQLLDQHDFLQFNG